MLAKSSFPRREIKCTFPPANAAATAWLDPLPPGPSENSFPIIVSPILGWRDARYAVSATKTPRITISLFDILDHSSGGMTPLRSIKHP